MQEQNNSQPKCDFDSSPQNLQANLITWIKQTYEGKSNEQIRNAQQNITTKLLQNFKIVEILCHYLKPPYQMDSKIASNIENFRNSCSILIKKTYYRIAENPSIDKQPYISLVYEILLTTKYGAHQIKQAIRVALQYIFNKDEKSAFKVKWKNLAKTEIISLLQHSETWTLQTVQIIHGLVLVFISYLNSLIKPEQQIAFVTELQNVLCQSVHLCVQFAKDNIEQSVEKKLLFLASEKIFEFFQMAFERILDQEDQIQEQAQNLKNSENLTNIMIENLFLLSNKETIITNYRELNQIKLKILQILYIMNIHHCNINITIIEILFITFIKQSIKSQEDYDDNDQYEQIVSKCMTILQLQLHNKKNYQFFLNNKIEILFALFMYCRTTPQQESYMLEQPQKFAQLAEQFTEHFNTSSIIKISASNFIRIFAWNIDEGLMNITELSMIFITDSLNKLFPNKSSSQPTELLKLAKQVYQHYAFLSLKEKQKLDIIFMVLSTLSEQIRKRQDIKIIITSMLITNYELFTKSNDEIVLIRLIRLIGYYPIAIYFAFIQNAIQYSKVFLVEGLNCFNRICKNQEYLQKFSIIYLVYINLMPFMEVTDPIFQRLINENYQTVLTKNIDLYTKVCTKIQQSFMEAIGQFHFDKNQQLCIKCLNYIEKMFRKEKKDTMLTLVQSTYTKMESHGIHIDLLQENFIAMYDTIIQKKIQVNNKIKQFVLMFSIPTHLHHYPQHTQYFTLLNKFIIKTDNTQILQSITNNLTTYLNQLKKQQFNFAILPYLTHSIGHLIIIQHNISINENFIKFLIYLILKKQNQLTHLSMNQCWLLFLLLHFVYIQPAYIRSLLFSNNKYYVFMIYLFGSKSTTKIQRKAAVLAAQQLLIHQTDQKLQQQIIKFCISVLTEQKNKFLLKSSTLHTRKPRQQNKNNPIVLGNEYEQQEEERMDNNEEQCYNKNCSINIFEEYIHPFDKIDQFFMFKQRILWLTNFYELSENQLPGITDILQHQWHQNFVRKLFKISK